ncbi:hypothetical protein SPRG_04963 [Saprolegnia parasitica CBS 223.65]|uniref:WRKY19-like zinc finger domain-containing protein n=1 Tax=Saprolegnia parasitica (strain CBS 223.65) TaxID=695850 RepID=A0A067CTN2_SAPPC|nr:hypothetical protein SPRG_04963 [Saprolegnia parasitica CBS 223.65]KDO29896.1 hypothetical protein SPRG_04963 [Saprolegnia parasitica CBS 223.65]|eukprot:XP_012199491.1 hypothetical protein SPRG_04963 [Saprolegnia parasitica CBS 223.65]
MMGDPFDDAWTTSSHDYALWGDLGDAGFSGRMSSSVGTPPTAVLDEAPAYERELREHYLGSASLETERAQSVKATIQFLLGGSASPAGSPSPPSPHSSPVQPKQEDKIEVFDAQSVKEEQSFLAAVETLRFTRVRLERKAKLRAAVPQESPDDDELSPTPPRKPPARKTMARPGLREAPVPSTRYKTRERSTRRSLIDSFDLDEAYEPPIKHSPPAVVRSVKKARFSKSRGYTVKPCEYPGCDKWSRTRGLCKRHGGGKRCQVTDCPKSDQGGGYCIKHGGGKSILVFLRKYEMYA